ncbi:hypothetical protein [Streptomyces sp. 5.8]|uniref:hypothetical protein n=1 Tax=Streptomyces sp. 5.8 TaxID=3406571 RepID=UPI003BB5167A
MGGEKGYLAFSMDGTPSVCGRESGAVPYLRGYRSGLQNQLRILRQNLMCFGEPLADICVPCSDREYLPGPARDECLFAQSEELVVVLNEHDARREGDQACARGDRIVWGLLDEQLEDYLHGVPVARVRRLGPNTLLGVPICRTCGSECDTYLCQYDITGLEFIGVRKKVDAGEILQRAGADSRPRRDGPLGHGSVSAHG